MHLLDAITHGGLFLALLSGAIAVGTNTLFLSRKEHRLAAEYVMRKRECLPVTAEMKYARLQALVQRGCQMGFLAGVCVSLPFAAFH
ncbi:hypothetical protein IP91_00635 [Pseudoduganella lurida]|uniref:Uncharacterized protein n=1 Tax=Pseudoduganella lurida TaxID=1036180 RepID=A0A562RKI9_9BURK|nr:hypothetical protein [Pseudoduganella lurida]TWI69565.1 hypothetical protein IP91_00635 [Pseudoduganella lurida]